MAVNKDQTHPDAVEVDDLARSLKLVLIALASAVVTAVLVIAIGGAWLDRVGRADAANASTAPLNESR